MHERVAAFSRHLQQLRVWQPLFDPCLYNLVPSTFMEGRLGACVNKNP